MSAQWPGLNKRKHPRAREKISKNELDSGAWISSWGAGGEGALISSTVCAFCFIGSLGICINGSGAMNRLLHMVLYLLETSLLWSWNRYQATRSRNCLSERLIIILLHTSVTWLSLQHVQNLEPCSLHPGQVL